MFYHSDIAVDELLRKCRKELNKEHVSFVQVGANDGVENDIANLVLKETDSGYFFEPIETSYNLLIHNKSNFKNCVFLQKAILPEELKGSNHMSILSCDPKYQGSSFTTINKGRHIEAVQVDCITVLQFINEFKITELDFLFCDAEGIDNLLIKDFLKYITPSVILFETSDWSEQDTNLNTYDQGIIVVPSNNSIKEILYECGYNVIDFSKKVNKSNNIIATKLL